MSFVKSDGDDPFCVTAPEMERFAGLSSLSVSMAVLHGQTSACLTAAEGRSGLFATRAHVYGRVTT